MIYVTMVTTNQNKMRTESQLILKKIIKPQEKREREERSREELQKQPENYYQNDRKQIRINGYFKCKYNKFSNQKI